jgi:CRP-like cAMP-binding protein
MHASEVSEEFVSVDECVRVLQPRSFFDGLTETDLRVLASQMRVRDYLAGATLFYEDDEPDACYFLAQGAVEVFKSDQTGKKLPLIILREGGIIGEMGLLNATPRSATARSLTSARLLSLPADRFRTGLEEGSVPMLRLGIAFARILAQRLSSMDERLFSLIENEVDGAAYRESNEWKQKLMSTWTGLSLSTRE